MKKIYIKPVIYVEQYLFKSSIAKCDIDIDTTEPLLLTKGTNLCKVGDNGHQYGKGELNQDGVTLFNDGTGTACYYDWDGRKDIVTQSGKSFAQSFYGNSSNVDNHGPSYEESIFFS